MDDFDLVQKIIAFVEEASPVLWKLAQREVFVSALRHFAWFIFLGLGAFVFYKIGRHYWTKEYEYSSNKGEGEFFAGVMYAGAAVTAILATLLLTTAVSLVLNPQYHAIDKLLSLIPGV